MAALIPVSPGSSRIRHADSANAFDTAEPHEDDINAPVLSPSQQCDDLLELGRLTAEFRDAGCESAQDRIVGEYAKVVDRLIKSGHWTETPDPEDLLPDERMPQAFFDFWECERLDP